MPAHQANVQAFTLFGGRICNVRPVGDAFRLVVELHLSEDQVQPRLLLGFGI